MTFIAEFAPDALRAGLATAELFGSAHQYLTRIQADAEAELANVKRAAESGNAYAAQFCPARAAECYTALAFVALGLGLYPEPMANCTCGYPHFPKHAETCPAVAPMFCTITPL